MLGELGSNPTGLNWYYCCTSSTKSSCAINLDSNKTEKCLTNSKPIVDNGQSCNGFCYSSSQICPDNPGYCVDLDSDMGIACDGRKKTACECSAPFETSPFYESSNTCTYDKIVDISYVYCGEREGAKFRNRQCYYPDSNHEYYQCLNRKDIDEDVLRTNPIFDSEKQVSNRKNYFQLFANSNITNNSITCGNKRLKIDCLNGGSKSITCENVIYSELELCQATDFASHNGWIDGEESKSKSYLEEYFIGKSLPGIY